MDSLTLISLDDSPAFSLKLASVMEGLGHKIICVHQWPQLLPTLRKESADALLLDLNMPVLQGEVVAKTVRRFYPSLPILFLTAEPSERAISACAEVGSARFLLKFENLPQELGKAIESIVSQAAS